MRNSMSLRSKIALILIGVFILYLGFYYGIQRFVIFPSFVALEQEEAKKDMERCVEALYREVHHLDAFVHDWASWDDTYRFIEDRNTSYIQGNLVFDVFKNNSLNLIYYCNTKGEVIWGEVRDLETTNLLQLGDFPHTAFSPTHPLLAHKRLESSIAGIFMTERGPMLIASRPILTSNNEGPIRGALIMGRFFGADLVKTIEEQTRITFQLRPVKNDSLTVNEKDVLPQITAGHPVLIKEAGNDRLHVYTTYPDILGTPALLMRAEIPRDITHKGTMALWFTTSSIIAAGLVIFIVMWILLKVIVTDSIGVLTQHIVTIGRNDDLLSRLSMKRRDEIGVLSNEFNRMVQNLSEARRKLLEQSYYSGMAEMAAGVLHNIRNSLNSIIGYLYLLRQDISKVPLEGIAMAQKELSRGNVSEERKKDLTQYLDLCHQSLYTLIGKIEGRLEGLADSATEIEKVLAYQDKFSHEKQVIEKVELYKVVREAMTMVPNGLDDTILIEIDPGVPTIGSMIAPRIFLLEVFTNILTNAAESIRRAGTIDGKILINAAVEKIDGADRVHVWICDNGVGIEPDNLDRVFERNFSTKKQGISGFGLHWCANSIAAMNGRIYAESKGKGHGACFHLLIPKDP